MRILQRCGVRGNQIANIPFLRFGNPFIDGMLHRDKVESVMIELKEEFGCEGRGV